MKLRLKIFLTNWINIVGISLAVYISGIVSELVKINTASDIQNAVFTGFIGGLIGIVMYGSIFWLGFLIAMFLLDFILMNESIENLSARLIIEWVLVSSPFMWWFFKYTQWVFLIAVIAFFITQNLRKKQISKLIVKYSSH